VDLVAQRESSGALRGFIAQRPLERWVGRMGKSVATANPKSKVATGKEPGRRRDVDSTAPNGATR